MRNYGKLSTLELLKMQAEIGKELKSRAFQMSSQIADIDSHLARTAPSLAVRKKSSKSAGYRNPETGQMWSGRGRAPLWITRGIVAGKSKKDFAV